MHSKVGRHAKLSVSWNRLYDISVCCSYLTYHGWWQRTQCRVCSANWDLYPFYFPSKDLKAHCINISICGRLQTGRICAESEHRCYFHKGCKVFFIISFENGLQWTNKQIYFKSCCVYFTVYVQVVCSITIHYSVIYIHTVCVLYLGGGGAHFYLMRRKNLFAVKFWSNVQIKLSWKLGTERLFHFFSTLMALSVFVIKH